MILHHLRGGQVINLSLQMQAIMIILHHSQVGEISSGDDAGEDGIGGEDVGGFKAVGGG